MIETMIEKQFLLIDDDVPKTFPHALTDIVVSRSLGGGTRSTFKVENTLDGQSYALKFGTCETQLKIEILLNVLYKRLGVPVITVQAYTAPEALTQNLGFTNHMGTVQLSEWLESHPAQDTQIMIAQARRDFIVHAFVGNIDIAKADNFIITPDNQALLVDSGANFIYRALGELRYDVSSEIGEIDSMRHPNINASGATWFADLNEEDIKDQANALLDKRDIIEETIWSLSAQLQLPPSTQHLLLTGFSHRFDSLAQRYDIAPQRFAKRDKVAIAGKTAAGVLHLQYVQFDEKHELCVLLSKRVRRSWCDNFGGKSDVEDVTLAHTARREINEESNGVIYYSDREFAHAPFHDIITRDTKEQQQLYRMYVIEGTRVNINDLPMNGEHTGYHWVTLDNIQKSLKENSLIVEENQTTISVQDIHNKDVIIFPPLYIMLTQQPIQTLIDNLLKGQPLSTQHTQSHADYLNPSQYSKYRPLTAPDQIKTDVTLTLLSQSKVLDKIKQLNDSSTRSEEPETPSLSQSELHLRAIMGDDFDIEAPIVDNVALFLEKYDSNTHISSEEKDKLIAQAVDMIQYEKNHPDDVFFYHGTNGDIAYSYKIYEKFYQALSADSTKHALRTDNVLFHRCLNISEFIAYFEKMGVLTNYNSGYMECALSTNLFLFGNHTKDSSYSIQYYIENKTNTQCDIKKMLRSSFQPMGIAEETIDKLNKLAKDFPHGNQGVLYQISFPKETTDNYAYAAIAGGILHPFLTKDGEKTTKITSLLEALNKGSLEKSYIEVAQARVMVPPFASLTARRYDWDTTSTFNSEQFEEKLQNIIEDMTYDTIHRYNPFNKLNSTLYPARYLSERYQKIGLASETQITDELLIQLIEAADFQSIILVVEESPSYKEDKPLISKNITYNRRVDKINDDKKTLLERLLAVNTVEAIEAIYSIFGKQFYKNKLDNFSLPNVLLFLPDSDRLTVATLYENKVQYSSDLIKVLKALPENDRLEFATRHQNKIYSISDMALVLDTLPDHDKLVFAMANQGHIYRHYELITILEKLPGSDRLALATEKQSIIQGSEFSTVLKILPNNHRLEFATKNQSKMGGYQVPYVLSELTGSDKLVFATANQNEINDGYDLRCFLRELLDNDRLDFATQNQSKIRGSELAGILEELPDIHRLAFAIKYKNKIRNDTEFLAVLNVLSSNDELFFKRKYKNVHKRSAILETLPYRPGFSRTHQNKIRNGFQLKAALLKLPENSRLIFATTYQDVIRDTDELAMVLDQLPVNNRLVFAIENLNTIRDGKELAAVLRTLSNHDRLDFATTNQKKIKNSDELIAVLDELLANDKFVFATAHQNKIYTVLSLAVFLSKLPSHERFDFVIANQRRIDNNNELTAVLNELPINNRLAFATSHHDKIKSRDDFSALLKKLPSNDRLVFATTYQNKISNNYILASVIGALPDNIRLAFATTHQNKIQDGHGLGTVLDALPDKDKIVFATRHEHKIQNSYELATVLSALPDKDKVVFVTRHEHKIQNGHELAAVLSALPDKDKVVFVTRHEHKIQNSYELAAVLRVLPDNDRLYFATRHEHKIRKGDELSEIIGELPKNQRFGFATTHQNKIQNHHLLAEILRNLPNKHKVYFATIHQSNIQHGYELAYVLNVLPDNSRLAFAILHQNKIENDHQFAVVIGVLPDNSRLVFTKKYHKKIHNGYVLAETVEKLTDNNGLIFATAYINKIKNGYELAAVLNALPSKDRFIFVYKCSNIIQDGYELAIVLNALSDNDRLAIATKYQNRIKDTRQLTEVLDKLIDNKLYFSTKSKNIVQNGYDLTAVLRKLSSKGRLFFTTANENKIRNGYEIAIILKELPNNRLSFAIKYRNKIQDAHQLAAVLNALPDNNRLFFATTHQNKIQNGGELAVILRQLPVNKRLFFAITHQSKIQDDKELGIILEMMTESDRLTFTSRYQKLSENNQSHLINTNTHQNKMFPKFSMFAEPARAPNDLKTPFLPQHPAVHLTTH